MTENYSKLPGKAYSFLSRSSVWAGDTHLVSVRNWSLKERYHRFFYTDIRAIVSVRTRFGYWINVVLGVFLAGSILLVLNLPAPVWGVPLILPFVLGLSVNLVKGPTCATYVITPVERKKIPALCRFKYVQGTIEEIRPKIEDRQGQVSVEELRERYRMLVRPEPEEREEDVERSESQSFEET